VADFKKNAKFLCGPMPGEASYAAGTQWFAVFLSKEGNWKN